jgi:hypothetical protein
MTGRIYRIAPKGHKYQVSRVDLNLPQGAVTALQSPNQARRYIAWQTLHETHADSVPALKRLWQSTRPEQRARAWNLLVRIIGREREYVNAALEDRTAEIRLLPLRYYRAENKDPVPIVKQLMNDSSPQVLRECALSLHRSKSEEAPELWAALAQKHDGKDRWYLEALGIGAATQDDKFFDAWLKQVGNNWNTPAGRDIIWRIRSTKAPALLVKIIKDPASPKEDRDRYIRSLDFMRGSERDAALVQLLAP